MTIYDFLESEHGKVIPVNDSFYELKKASTFKRLIIKNQEQLNKLTARKPSSVSTIESVVIWEGVKVIPDRAFCRFESLRTLELPSTLCLIGEDAFSSCTSLESIVIPDGVTMIKARTFARCTKLKEVYLPDCVTDICYEAFYQCYSLEYIIGGRGLESINLLAFIGCNNLKEIPTPLTLTDIKQLSSFNYAYLFFEFMCVGNEKSCVNVENDVWRIKDGVKVICDKALSKAVNKAVILPETVRNISLFAFDCKSDECLPKNMNKPKDYFTRNSNHDFHMSFLLIDTVWKDEVTDEDIINIFLYHKDETARTEACRRLWKTPDRNLHSMLDIAATESDKQTIMQRICEYTAAYLSDISEKCRGYLRKRLRKVGEERAYDIVIRQRMHIENVVPKECLDLLGADGLEPYFMEKYLKNCIDIFPFNLQLNNVRMKDGSIAPREFVLSIIYAYIRSKCFYLPGLDTYSDYPDASKKANKAVELVDFDSLVRFIDHLCIEKENRYYLHALKEASPDFKTDKWAIRLFVDSLAEQSAWEEREGFDYEQDVSLPAEKEFNEVDKYKPLTEDEEFDYEEYFDGLYGSEFFTNEEYYYCVNEPIAQESEPIEIHSVSFDSAVAEFGIPQREENLAKEEEGVVDSDYNEGERYRLLGEEEEEEEFDAAEQERLYFEDIRYRFLAVEEDCNYFDHIDLDDYDLDEETFDELCMGII